MQTQKIRRSYDLDPDCPELLNSLTRLGYIKEKAVSAGIRLFMAAPTDLRDAALAGNMELIAQKMGWIQRFQVQCVGSLEELLSNHNLIQHLVRNALAGSLIRPSEPAKSRQKSGEEAG